MNVEMAVPMTAKTMIEPRFWKKLPYRREEGERECVRERERGRGGERERERERVRESKRERKRIYYIT